MGRRQSWSVQVARMQAAEARRQAAEIRAEEAQTRREERLAKQEHVQGQQEEAEEQNRELTRRVAELQAVLTAGLRRAWALDVNSLKRPVEVPPFDPKADGQAAAEPKWEQFAPKPSSFLAKLLPGNEEKFERLTQDRRGQFDQAVDAWRHSEDERETRLAEAKATYQETCERLRAEVAQQHVEVDGFMAGYRSGAVEPTVQYFSLVMDRDELPEGFPSGCRVAYVPDSRQLVLEREIPGPDIVPREHAWHYVRGRDVIEPSLRPAIQTRAMYASVVSQLALRTLHGASLQTRHELPTRSC